MGMGCGAALFPSFLGGGGEHAAICHRDRQVGWRVELEEGKGIQDILHIDR
ncbi:hypothetical protein ACFLXX_03410 [Chloroflexota bacterium]